MVAAVSSKQQIFLVEERRSQDRPRWCELRRQLCQREEARRQQWRFRKHSAAYLIGSEARLLQ